MIRAVVFDLDGTLIDSTEAIVGSLYHAFDALHEPRPARQTLIDSIGRPLEEQIAALTSRPPEDFIPIYRRHYEETACARTALLPEARETLAALQDAGLKLGFATSKQRAMAVMLLEHLGVLGHFAARIGPDEVKRPKPGPEAVLVSAQALGVTTAELFFVGDMHFDLVAAARANVRCLAVCTGYETRQQLEALQPEAVFDRLGEIRDYVLANLK